MYVCISVFRKEQIVVCVTYSTRKQIFALIWPLVFAICCIFLPQSIEKKLLSIPADSN